ncbi:hypothetical protein SH528x_006018 [Novipirellula sp. SH528]|uniref:hypothetical protein n=1 Tax=Novipirellula sp. SH528 TaxID=3454466 RepID=UPI003F9F41E6
MKSRSATVACLLVVTGFVAAMAYGFNTPAISATPSLAPFEFNREAAASPEAAARTLFRGISTESPTHFVQHLLLGVCDGPIDTLQKFAECLHETEFSHDGERFSFYDLRELRKGINPKKPIRIVAVNSFDTEDKQVAALQSQMMSTYYGQAFVCIDVAAEGYDGLEYQTRIVVAQVDGDWYAMPRCRSARSFYKIADAMRIAPPEAKGVK